MVKLDFFDLNCSAIALFRRFMPEKNIEAQLRTLATESTTPAFQPSAPVSNSREKLTLENAIAIDQILVEAAPALATSFRDRCRALFPVATAFMDEAALAKNKELVQSFKKDLAVPDVHEKMSLDQQLAKLTLV
jgi:hypothetical protein